MRIDLPVLAGTISTLIFLAGTFPMLAKAWRTKDLRSYSKGMLVLNNTGNVIHAIYVFSLPPGPIWALHTFYLVTTGLMLAWYLRYAERPRRGYPGLSTLAASWLRAWPSSQDTTSSTGRS